MAPPLEPPRDLTIPSAGSRTARDVLSRALARLHADLVRLARHVPRSAAQRADMVAFQRALSAVQKAHPGALLSALRRPTIGASLRCFRREVDRDRADALVAEVAAHVLLELALAGALEEPVRLARFPRRLLAPGAGLAVTLPADAHAIAIAEGRVAVEAASGHGEIALGERGAAAPGVARGGVDRAAFLPIEGGIALALADNNPLALFETHPDKHGNAIDLGGRDSAEWIAALRASLALVAEHLPDLRAEMDLYLHLVVPVGWYEERHLSASYQEAIGTVYLSLHPSPMTMVEALVHEFSHNKLNALFELDDVLENAWSPLYESPVRPDPRPLHGVLLAVHAFLPVARLYEAMIDAGDPRAASASFRDRFAAIRRTNAEAAATVLEHGRPTPVGAALLDEIRRWDAHYRDRYPSD